MDADRPPVDDGAAGQPRRGVDDPSNQNQPAPPAREEGVAAEAVEEPAAVPLVQGEGDGMQVDLLVGVDENEMAEAGGVEEEQMPHGAAEELMAAAGEYQRMIVGAPFHFNPAEFPELGAAGDGGMEDSDDESDNNGNNAEEEAMDDILDNLDDDEDGMDEDEVENGVAFVHVFSPRQQLDSDHDGSETEDENDGQRVEHFDINLPGQHLYIPDDEDHSADPPPDPAPLLPPLVALPPEPFNEEPQEPPQQEQQPASSDLDGLRIFDDLPNLSGGPSSGRSSTHCPPLPVETIRLPVLEHTRQHSSLMVLPGMKVPLMISSPRDRAVIAAARRTPQRAFVSLNLRQSGPVHGCTLQVVQAREGLGNLHIIARATQRFRLHDVHREVSGVVVAEVECLPEVLVTAPLASIRHVSHDRHHDPTSRQLLLLKHHAASPNSPSSPLDSLYPDAATFRCSCGLDTQDRERHRDRHRASLLRKRRLCSRYTSVLTQVPPWVLQELDVYRLAAAVRKYLLVLGSEGVRIPESPVSVCEYACLNMPLPDPHRRQLLQLSCCHQKLLYLLNLQEKWHSLVCTQCHAVITKREDLIIVSSEGQQAAFVNPRGFVHEIVTVRYTDRLYLMGAATAEHSWYPGYSWTIASCSGCRQHVGWKFTANRPSLRPRKFYGLTRGGVMPM